MLKNTFTYILAFILLGSMISCSPLCTFDKIDNSTSQSLDANQERPDSTESHHHTNKVCFKSCNYYVAQYSNGLFYSKGMNQKITDKNVRYKFETCALPFRPPIS